MSDRDAALPTLEFAAVAAMHWFSGYADADEHPEFTSDGKGVNSEAIYMELRHALGTRPYWEYDNPRWSFVEARAEAMARDGHDVW